MKKIILIAALLCIYTSSSLLAQSNVSQRVKPNSAIIIKFTPLPFLFETGVGGNLVVDNESIAFTPVDCSEKDKKASSLFPCNNHLISNVTLNFAEVSKIKRRNFLLLIPNRVFVKKTTGEVYIFTTFSRKHIIDKYNSYKIQQVSLGLD